MPTEDAPQRVTIGGYEVLGRLGTGGAGEVFEAVRHAPGGFRKIVALKRLSPDAALSNEARERFSREAKLCAELTHPNIVAVHDYFIDGGVPVLVMERLVGRDLQALVATMPEARVPAWVAVAIAQQVLAALVYAHDFVRPDGTRQGILHRDVTPKNVFLCDDGTAKLLDFGVARALGAKDTTASGVVGTLKFMPPERLAGERGDERSDVYQVGALLHFLLCGEPPTESFAAGLDDTHAMLRDVVTRALSRDPAARFGRAGEMREALVRCGTHPELSPRTTLTEWLRSPSTPPAAQDGSLVTQPEPHADAAREVRHPRANVPARFGIHEVIGSGGMGEVVRATDHALDREVALKLLHATKAHEPLLRARMLREARVAATLRHPNMVHVFDVDPHGEFLVMELVHGENLAQRLARDGRLAPSDVRRIGAALLDALAEAHAHGVVHRDIKPSNVLIDEQGTPKLADFGVAHLDDSDLTETGARVGTPAYMAPEQLRGATIDARTDLYALGVTLYEAATGERFHGASGRPEHPTQLVLETAGDKGLAETLARATAEHARDRFPSAAAFREALLEPALRNAPSLIASAAHTPRPWRFMSRALVAAAGVLGVAAFVVAFAIPRESPRPPRQSKVATASRAGPSPTPSVSDRPLAVGVVPFLVIDGALSAQSPTGLAALVVQELEHVPLLAPRVTPVPAFPVALDQDTRARREAASAAGTDAVVLCSVESAPIPPGTAARVAVTLTMLARDGEVLFSTRRVLAPESVSAFARASAREIAAASAALRALLEARAASSLDARALLAKGQAALGKQELDRAEGYFRVALERDPSLLDARYGRILAAWWRGQSPTDVSDRLREARENGLDSLRTDIAAGIERVSHNDYPAAITHLERVVRSAPRNVDALYGLFEAQFHGGQPSAAMVTLRRLTEIDPAHTLGVIHAVAYFQAHGDAEGLSWAMSLGHAFDDSTKRLWQVREKIAARDYAGAIASSEAQTARNPSRFVNDEIGRRDLVWLRAIRGELDLAAEMVSGATTRYEHWDALVRLAIAVRRNRTDDLPVLFRNALDAARREAVGGGSHASPLFAITNATLAWASPQDLLALQTEVAEVLSPEVSGTSHVQAMLAMLAGARDDADTLRVLSRSPYPETQAIVRAFEAEREGHRDAVEEQWAAVLAASPDGQQVSNALLFLARARARLGDTASAARACDEARQPRTLTWSWAFSGAICDRITTVSHAAPAR